MEVEVINTFYTGDARKILEVLPDKSVHCTVTSPPYYGLRDYGVDGQLGLEKTPEEYVSNLVEVFREVRRVLRDDGTLWLNLGDSYASGGRGGGGSFTDERRAWKNNSEARGWKSAPPGLKNKDLVGIPWMVAFALRADGWYLRTDIIWEKPNAMPSSVMDRPTRSHEYIFLFSKSSRYYYDAESIKESAKEWSGQSAIFERSGPVSEHIIPGQLAAQHRKNRSGNKERKLGPARGRPDSHIGGSIPWEGNTRNKRTVWNIATKPFKGAHFAVFPPELVKPCILAGCPEGGTVLDPFGGSGTVLWVASQLGRDSIYIDLKPEYVEMAKSRVEEPNA